MFLLHKPSDEEVHRFIARQRALVYSYAEVGATNALPPQSYNVDHSRIRVGTRQETFTRAKKAMRRWEMFNLG